MENKGYSIIKIKRFYGLIDSPKHNRPIPFFQAISITHISESYTCQVIPSYEILSEISKIYDLNFEYVELGIEGPEGNPQIINKKKIEIARLQKFREAYRAN